MDSSVNVEYGLHQQLIPHRDQYGISSPSSSALLPEKFPPPPVLDPLAVFWHQQPSYPLTPQQMAVAFPFHPPPPPAHAYDVHDQSVPPGTREKRHCCQSCNKRFDRPSTLKKHMLVHTGEKAWACEICGRRFSVSSNLNRHARRCREKWAKSASLATDTPLSPSAPSESPCSSASSSPSSSSDGSDSAYCLHSPQPIDQAKQQQQQQQRRSSVKLETDGSHGQHVAGKPQRRRRKGSPAEPWIPASLASFNLDPITRSAPTPLPAAVPSTSEERNSFADTPLQAYHPSCWTGRLVGPSHVPRNEEVPTGRFYGKLIVF